MKRKYLILLGLLAGFILIQFINRPDFGNPPVKSDLKAPEAVKNILKRACYDCHSNEGHTSFYDHIAPISWRVAQHIQDGRKYLNFSNWDSLAPGDQKAKLWEAVNQIIAGAMPLKDYELVHPSAKISGADLTVLKNYLTAGIKVKTGDTAKINAEDKQYRQWQVVKAAAVKTPVSLNGIPYIADYKNWQVVSTTDRADNGTMRVIFGNDVAIKAIRENHMRPWPDGTIFAKVAWDKIIDADGSIRTGEFKQVEYMIKDAKKYASTMGWGWSRFKTPKLVPYGKTALFTTECINCHRPMANRDFVFTLPVKH